MFYVDFRVDYNWKMEEKRNCKTIDKDKTIVLIKQSHNKYENMGKITAQKFACV